MSLTFLKANCHSLKIIWIKIHLKLKYQADVFIFTDDFESEKVKLRKRFWAKTHTV